MLTIRLTRKGKKNQPFFRIVVIDKKRSSKGGRAVEILGYVDPLTKKRSLKKERILHWIKNGAQPSATIHNLLVQEKVIEGRKVHVAKIKKVTTPLAPATLTATAPVASTPEKAAKAPKGEPKSEVPKDMPAQAEAAKAEPEKPTDAEKSI